MKIGNIIILVFILIICVLLSILFKPIEGFESHIIPLHIYQTWGTKRLPTKMHECVEKIKTANPEFEHHLFDDAECREFIQNNFESDVVYAYDNLIPGAFKADLWRYCILYKKGGIYLDIKYEPVNGFKFIDCVDKEYFVLERPYMGSDIKVEDELKLINHPNYYNNVYDKIDTTIWKDKLLGLYNALIIVKPNNPILLKCIQQIVHNVKNKTYGHSFIYPTGPGLLGEKYFHGDMSKINDMEMFYSIVGTYIISRNQMILKHYDEYRYEQQKNQKIPYYVDLWINKKIYK